MNRLQQMLARMGGMGGGMGAGPAADTPLPDTAEKVQISSLSLLKMLKHGESVVSRPFASIEEEIVYSMRYMSTELQGDVSGVN
jgi:hypothetical protein